MRAIFLPLFTRIGVVALLSVGLVGNVIGSHAPSFPEPGFVQKVFREGRQGELIHLIDRGLSVNSCDGFGVTALSMALATSDLDLAHNLLQRGFDPTLTYKHESSGEIVEIGRKALRFAIKAGAADVVDELLARGLRTLSAHTADEPLEHDAIRTAIEADHVSIVSALFAAVDPTLLQARLWNQAFLYLEVTKSVGILEGLAAHGANLNAHSSRAPFSPALVVYAQRNWHEGVEAILRLGADASATDDKKRSAEDVTTSPEIKRLLAFRGIQQRLEQVTGFPIVVLRTAVLESEDKAIELVSGLAPASLERRDDRDWTILTYALSLRLTNLASALITQGANVRHVTRKGSSMIAFATTTGDVELVRRIAGTGADVNATEGGSPTALNMAVVGADLPMVEALLALGAQPEPPRRGSGLVWQSALMLAVKAGDIRIATRLLEAEADVHAVDSSGENLVFYAVRSRKPDVLQWVVSQGGYAHLKTPDGRNALILAAETGELPMIKALVALGLRHPEAPDHAIFGKNPEAIQYLKDLQRTERPQNPDTEFWQRWTIPTDEVREYIAAGRNVNHAEGGPTPLQQMTLQNNVEAVALLLDHGADPARRGNYAQPAVMLIFNSRECTQEQTLALLQVYLDHGVSPDSQNYLYGMDPPQREPTGATLLQTAIDVGNGLCAELLLRRGANPALISSLTGFDAYDTLAESKRFTAQEKQVLLELMPRRSRRQSTPIERAPQDALAPSQA